MCIWGASQSSLETSPGSPRTAQELPKFPRAAKSLGSHRGYRLTFFRLFEGRLTPFASFREHFWKRLVQKPSQNHTNRTRHPRKSQKNIARERRSINFCCYLCLKRCKLYALPDLDYLADPVRGPQVGTSRPHAPGVRMTGRSNKLPQIRPP